MGTKPVIKKKYDLQMLSCALSKQVKAVAFWPIQGFQTICKKTTHAAWYRSLL